MPWEGWPFERFVLLFVGAAFAVIWVQVTLFHWGGAFHRWQMWAPVLFGPLLAVTGIVLGIWLTPALAVLGYLLFGIGAVAGLIGTYYHFRAIGYYVLGYTIRNFIEGPPPMLPITFAAMSALGILAIVWAVYL